MSAIRHGYLTMLRMPQPTFQPRPGGMFDTGMRKFKVAATYADHVMENVLKVGRSDEEILRRSSGGTTPGWRKMFVDERSVDYETGDSVVISVNYVGLLWPKSDTVVFSTSTAEVSVFPNLTSGWVTTPVRIPSPAPVINHKWLSDRGRPSAVTPGTPLTPPGITENESRIAAAYYVDFLPDSVSLFVGWILSDRRMRSPGGLARAAIWEVDDTYSLINIRADTSS